MTWPHNKTTGVRLVEQLNRLTQRTAGVSSLSGTEDTSFRIATKEDLANAYRQLNTVYYNLARTLCDDADLDALQYGLSGNVIYTDIEAMEGSADVYWDSGRQRGRTIKESLDVMLAEVSRLEGSISTFEQTTALPVYDDTELRSLVETNSLNLDQIKQDAFGPNYLLNDSGVPALIYSLAQHIEALGGQFEGFPGTGLVFDTAYPALGISGVWTYETTSNVTSNSNGDYTLDDFVHGSPTLDDSGVADYDNRVLFDKSKGAFRAGGVLGTQWDDINRGAYSVGFGYNSAVAGQGSVVSGGHTNIITSAGDYGAIPGGKDNQVTATYGQASGHGAKADVYGARVFAGGYDTNVGDSQFMEVIWRGSHAGTVGATQIFINGEPGETFPLEDNHYYYYELRGLAVQPSVPDARAYTQNGMVSLVGGAVTYENHPTFEDTLPFGAGDGPQFLPFGFGTEFRILVLDKEAEETGVPQAPCNWVIYGRILKAPL